MTRTYSQTCFHYIFFRKRPNVAKIIWIIIRLILVPTSYYQLHTKFFPHLIMVMKAGVAFLNTSKATDRVWQDALFFKLHQNGISVEIHTLIKEFLSCRKQRVMFNGQHSPRAYCQSWRSSTVNSRTFTMFNLN